MADRQTTQTSAKGHSSQPRLLYPFAAIVGQREMKLSLALNVIDPEIGGVLIMGHRGTGKSSAVRALADLLPEIWCVRDCPFRCDPAATTSLCAECQQRQAANTRLMRERRKVAVADLPLGATEDRVCGSIDIEQALKHGSKAFEPGLLARANRGFLYVDEINLLEDHLVDLLLDVSVTGLNRVERESVSVEHPANFVLVGSGNPEEGELRPQLLDRFGLFVEVTTENDPERRLEVLERHQQFSSAPEEFVVRFESQQLELRRRIDRGRRTAGRVTVDRSLLRKIAELSSKLKVDGHRAELTIARAAKAIAAFEGRRRANEQDVIRVAPLALQHRLRHDPLEETAGRGRIEQALEKIFPESRSNKPSGNDGSGENWPAELHSDNGEPPIPRPLAKGAAKDDAPPENRSAKAKAQGAELDGGSPGALVAPGQEGKVPKLSLSNHKKIRRTFWGLPSDGGRERAGRTKDALHGRYVTAVAQPTLASRIALDATLRTMAAINTVASQNGSSQIRSASALRFKQLARRRGCLFIFAIDNSGSMAAKRIHQAKGAALGLLRQSYLNRDYVAIVAFRESSAELVLSPSRSILRARRVLESLSVGGGTPLSAALARALALVKRQNNRDVVLLLFTDGHANVPLRANARGRTERFDRVNEEVRSLGNELRTAGVITVVVETQSSFWLAGGARELAKQLDAQLFDAQLLTRPAVHH